MSYKSLLAVVLLLFANAAIAQNTVISADMKNVKGKTNTVFKECIGAGRANEGLRADWQRQLKYVKEQCGFKYIRMHGLLTDDMGVYKEDKNGNPIYNFQYIDELYDYLLSIQMKPFVEFGFMPQALASGNKTIFWWRGNVTPPKDYKKWADLITALVKHWTERYGAAEVKTWYFEIWNEPNLKGFWSGTQQEYFKLYDVSAKAIKAVSSDYRVGGPATAGCGWIPEFLQHCADNKTPVDFASTHTYGVSQGFLDEMGDHGTVLSHNPTAIYGEVKRSREQVKASAFPNAELHFTEWSSSYTPADPIHDSYHEAAYILDKLKHVDTAAHSMSYWVFTDIFEEPGPRMTPFHGGFGLINYQSINKPAFYAYQFLNKLGATELKNENEHAIITKNANGDVQALFWNFTVTNPDSVNNQSYYNQLLPAKPAGAVTLTIKNVQPGKYRIEEYRIGYKQNDAYSAYLEMKAPSQLTKEQVAALKKVSNGAPAKSTIVTVKDNYTATYEMKENDVVLITLKKIGK